MSRRLGPVLLHDLRAHARGHSDGALGDGTAIHRGRSQDDGQPVSYSLGSCLLKSARPTHRELLLRICACFSLSCLCHCVFRYHTAVVTVSYSMFVPVLRTRSLPAGSMYGSLLLFHTRVPGTYAVPELTLSSLIS